jgi:hypothetical protein
MSGTTYVEDTLPSSDPKFNARAIKMSRMLPSASPRMKRPGIVNDDNKFTKRTNPFASNASQATDPDFDVDPSWSATRS